MPKYRECSVDEYLSKRQQTSRDGIVYRAASMPKSFNAEERSQVFVMTDETTDSYGDVVKANGADLYRFEKNPIALLNHRSDQILGTWSEVQKKPQRVEGKVTLAKEGTAPHIDMAFSLMSQGILRGASIGFMPTKLEMRLDDSGEPMWCYTILEWELYETSVCAIPANPSALARSAGNSDELRICRDYLEQVLDEWVKSPEGLLMPRVDYEKAYKVIVEKVAEDATAPAAAATTAETVKDGDEDETPPEPEDPEELPDEASKAAAAEAAAFPEFLARAEKGDTFRIYSQMLRGGDRAAFIEKGVSLHHKDSDKIDTFEFQGGVTDEHKQAIAARMTDLEGANADENKTGTDQAPTKSSSVVVNLTVDTTAAEAAAAKVEGIFSRIAKSFPMFFPKAVADERVEPTIVPIEPPAPPSDEAKAAARAKAAALRSRLADKGLIAA